MEEENGEDQEEDVEIENLRPQAWIVVHHVAYQEKSMVVMLLITSPAISVEPRVSRDFVYEAAEEAKTDESSVFEVFFKSRKLIFSHFSFHCRSLET